MLKAVPTAELHAFIEETLFTGGSITLAAIGNSMYPMLHHLQDTVTIGPVANTPGINDVVLYKRENDQFVMHRIVDQEANGDYVMCGDNQFAFEHHIRRQQVIGILQSFTCKGSYIPCTSSKYKLYVFLLPVQRHVRHGLCTIRNRIGSIKCWLNRQVNGNG